MECGTMGGNMIKHSNAGPRQLTPLHFDSLPIRKVCFSNDVTVMCTNPWKRTCMISHCEHGQVPSTITQLQKALITEVAPLSTFRSPAVLSSSGGANDEIDLMQRHVSMKPRSHNDPNAPPWYGQEPAAFAVEAADPNPDWVTETEESSEQGEENDGTPPDDDGPPVQPPAADDDRQSALLFHLTDVPVHVMLHWVHFDTMMREIAHHFAINRAELLDCHDMNFFPADIPEATVPIIVQFAQDIPVGQPAVLILVDIAIHGQEQELHFQTAPRVRRKVIAVPSVLSRQAMLIQTQVFEYCRFEHNRCLINHNGAVWPLQELLPKQVQHGDYVEIIVPPPARCEEPTELMLQHSQQWEVDDIWDAYYIPTSPSEPPIASDTDVSPSLVDSEEIRNEFGPRFLDDPDIHEDDAASLMQSQQVTPSASTEGVTPAASAAPIVNDSCVLTFSFTETWPFWFRAMATAFGEGAIVERDDEGPVATLTTWYVDCTRTSVNENSRSLRIDSHANLWAHDVQHLWRDKIQPDFPVHFAWVRPKPRETPFARTFGHLIVYQHPNDQLAPVLLHLDFHALNIDGTAHAVAVLRHTSTPEEVVELAKLERVCRGRRCTLHRGLPGKKWYDFFTAGECIKLSIPPPGGRANDELHWSLGSVELAYAQDFQPETPAFSMLLEDQPMCIQRLYELWLQNACRGSVDNERTLVVTTWYLDGAFYTHNDEQRPALLGDDFTTWSDDLRRVWRDKEDASADIEFVIVKPTPPCSPLASIHVLLHQQIAPDQAGLIVSVYDNAVMGSAPHSLAVVCPADITRDRLIEATGKTFDCHQHGVTCRVWSERSEILSVERRIQNGQSLQIHIYRAQLHNWDSEEDDEEHFLMQASSSIATMNQPDQPGMAEEGNENAQNVAHAFCFNVNAPVFDPARPPVASLPEQLQDLFALWDRHAFSWENEERKSSVLTWFLSPGTHRLRCGYPRKVHLFEDYMQWESHMKLAWRDSLVLTRPVFFFVVQPTPVALEHDIAAHVLLVQEPLVDAVSSLVTIFDNAVHGGHPFRIAIVTHEHITQTEVIERIGYTEELQHYAGRIACTFWHASFTFHAAQRVPGCDGDHIVVDFMRTNVDPGWQPPFLPVAPGMEGLHFLQTQARKVSSKRSINRSDENVISLDIEQTQEALTWFDAHFTLPAFDIEASLEGKVHWLPESLSWIRDQWFACDGPIDHIRIYYDGSFKPDTCTLGFAAIAFVSLAGDWKFAGAVSGKEENSIAQGSYRAELLASTLASKFLYDLCKIQFELFSCQPTCDMVFDSLTVGRQSEGRWKAARAIEACHFIRSILRLCGQRYGTHVRHRFCPSHAGEPGNELVDQIAFGAASGHPLQDWTPFVQHTQEKGFGKAMEWAWMLFTPMPEVTVDVNSLLFPAKPATTPSADVIPAVQNSVDCPHGASINLNLATCPNFATE